MRFARSCSLLCWSLSMPGLAGCGASDDATGAGGASGARAGASSAAAGSPAGSVAGASSSGGSGAGNTGGRSDAGTSGAGGAPAGSSAAGSGATAGGGNPGSAGNASGGSPGSAGAAGTGGAPTPTGPAQPLVNGIQWADTTGKPIQAHGGGMIKVGEYYYWFGENRNANGSFYAVSAYRSRDLRNWEFTKDVLRSSSNAELNPANIERPKVVYNASTGKYVMWMHWENGVNYGEARAAVAVSSTVDGDYAYQGSFRPFAAGGDVTDHGKPGYMSRDCGLFVDDDQKAYFISATNENYDLNLYLLTADYLKVDKLAATLFKGGHREAPALFKRNGTYFLLTSGATGWDPNQASYATSSAIASGWSAMKNVGDGNTFYSQSTYVLPVQGTAGTSYLYMGDRWAGAWDGRVNDSTYVWQPITFPSATSMSMSWNNTLAIDAGAGTITGATRNFRLVNAKSGKALEVEGASSADGASIIQNPTSSATNQQWGLKYDGAGFFRITNVGSNKVLDVPDESTADGVKLKQWQNLDGDNQAWLLIDLGGGLVQIRNKHSNKFVGVVGGASDDGTAIEQRAASNGDEQRWRLTIVQ